MQAPSEVVPNTSRPSASAASSAFSTATIRCCIPAWARQRAIGHELRRMYDDVAQEQVPDDFMDLLRQIDEAEDKGGKKVS